MLSSSREFWTEFDWEKELRKDDERVHTYLSELPRFIDLPQEDAVIYKRIQCREELIPHGGVWPAPEPPPPPEEEEEEEPRESWSRRDGAGVYIGCGKLAKGLTLLFTMDPNAAETPEFIRLLAFLGKIMARTRDIMNLAPDELPALKIALCKRIAADLNDCIGLLNDRILHASGEESAAYLSGICAQLKVIREDILELLFRLRGNAGKGGRD